ncbi:hypothetical protein F0U44_12305 [Nocardioides humilatus]|uniref:Uncharacterized protein n=1 Tax=Nocardioides humilatus TaxID=2607660 RepID=A0A5B1LEZ0_9ACTN|nr:MXAN_6640 family putative metalloprotease [Nocardioides humilatus]KAA1419225.1 hypothetical protein F0U44_12305 [Nocardioides humilatus]
MFRLGVAALLLSALVASPSADATTSADPQHTNPRAALAEKALDKVTSLVDNLDQTDGDLTLALRDLAVLKGSLPAAEQARASTYLSRPTANPNQCPDYACYDRGAAVHRVCTARACVHYVRKTEDADNGVPSADEDRDGTPNYVERVLATMSSVDQKYVDAGYRRPLGDGHRGGDDRPDVYLAQIGNQSLYGYCTTDADNVPSHGATWAYCVLDNDYARSEFPVHTPIQNMQVTAAHEYFHAVQFGYDIGEDAWFMEATATWAEDEVFDKVNDNVSYLPIGPMGHPDLSLDTFRNGYWYGAWIFFRHVTEHFPQSQAGMPTIVRTMWRKADAADADAPNLSSIEAIEAALEGKDSTVAAQFLRMAADNLHPRRWYDEGSRYPGTKVDGTWSLGPALTTKTAHVAEDHLTSASYRFEPSVTGRQWRLGVTLDLAPLEEGSAAVVRVLMKAGGVRTNFVTLSDEGDFTGNFLFDSNRVKAVEVTVANGSTRYTCGVGTSWSCEGRPLDQRVAQKITAAAHQN